MFSVNGTLNLIQELKKEKSLFLNEFYEYIKCDNLNLNKEYLHSITPLKFKDDNCQMDYYDLFFEISSQLDFVSNFNFKKAILIFMDIKHISQKTLIFETLFHEMR